MIPAVHSLVKNSDVDKIYVLIEDDVFPYDLPVEAINVSRQQFFRDDGPNYHCIWSYMALMRAALHRVFPQYDKILSLDVDTIVDKDISGLWDLPIDNFYLGGVKEPVKSQQNLYVNAGVMLLNLKKLRDGKGDEIIETLNTRKFTWPEQDCINLLCAGHIYEMSPEYNWNDWTTQTETPKILHFAGKKNYLNLPIVEKYAPAEIAESVLFAGKKHYLRHSHSEKPRDPVDEPMC